MTRSPVHPIRRKLLSWSRKQKRSLPWRGTRDPYRIWVSEVMLQQTTVEAVAARYDRFLLRFPDLSALARAREETVLAAWSGLGYYERARNLRRAARRVVREHGGKLPADPGALARLPGLGRYTSSAVACLAHGTRVPAVDANVTRVLSRLFAIGGAPGRRRHRKAVQARAEQLFSRGSPGGLTAALMDLGQLVCRARRPLCGSCPLASDCAARRRGSPEAYPRRKKKSPAISVFLACAIVRREDRALLARRPRGWLQGMWEFPSAEGATPSKARDALWRRIRALGLSLEEPAIGAARHAIVNRRLSIEIFPASSNPNFEIRNSKSSESRWFRRDQLERAALPTLTRKVARAAGLLVPRQASEEPLLSRDSSEGFSSTLAAGRSSSRSSVARLI